MSVLEIVDRISRVAGKLAGWLFFIIGLILTLDVVARFVFLKPTIWAGDIAVTLQIWGAYLAAAYVLQQRAFIRITAFIGMASATLRRAAEALTLVVIAGFCAIAVWQSIDIVIESVEFGRRASSMLAMPKWISEISIPIGFGLLFLQALADLIRLPLRPAPEFSDEVE